MNFSPKNRRGSSSQDKKSDGKHRRILSGISGISRTSTQSDEGKQKQKVEYVKVVDPSLIKEVLRDLKIPEDKWKATRKAWVGKAEKLEGWEVIEIPKYFQRTAVLSQYMGESLLVLYARTNSSGNRVYKAVEHKADMLWDFFENENLDEVLSDFCDVHNIPAVRGSIETVNGIRYI